MRTLHRIEKRIIGVIEILSLFAAIVAGQFANAGDCVDISQLPFSITGRIDKNHYEMEAETNDEGAIHIVLETKKAEFPNPGHPFGIKITPAGFKSFQMESGFEKSLEVIKECDIITFETTPHAQPGVSLRKLIKGK